MAIDTKSTLITQSRQSLVHEVHDSALRDRYPARPLSPAAQARKADVEAMLTEAIRVQALPCADGRVRRDRIETFLNVESTWQAWNRMGWELT